MAAPLNIISSPKKKGLFLRMTVLIILILSTAAILLYKNNLEMNKQSTSGAQRISGTMCDIICPAAWDYDQIDNSYLFTYSDGSSVIFDIWEHEKNIFSPLDLNQTQIKMLLESIFLKYGRDSKNLKILGVGQGKFAGLYCINFDYETIPNAKNGTGMIFFSNEQRFVYAATSMTPGDSRPTRICTLMKNYIEIKEPWTTPLYQKPFIDSQNYSEHASLIKNTDINYAQALQLWQNSKDNQNNILNSIKAFQIAMEELCKTNTGGLIYGKRQQLLDDYKTVQKVRMEGFVKMKSQITQYIKLNNTDMARQLLNDMLSSASLDNEISLKEWALKRMGNLKKSGE